MGTASAIAHANIAFIKYWGNRNDALRLPANGSISMNLAGLTTRTTVHFTDTLETDCLILNGQPVSGPGLDRVRLILDRVRQQAGIRLAAEVISENNFPTGAGIASSASAFAALALAATCAAGLTLSEHELSRLARLGSGSACRSIPAGFVEWYPGTSDADSYAVSLAPPEHWDLVDCIAIIQSTPKAVGSTEGHTLAWTSPIQQARVNDAPRRLDLCRRAILQRDFDALATVMELDSDLMHAVMMTSQPPLLYWQPATVAIFHAVRSWRAQGLPVAYTVDAGPNVHVICSGSVRVEVAHRLRDLPGVQQVLVASVGGPARLEE